MKWAFFLLLVLLPTVSAHSSEAILVRATAYNPQTREYTFTCTPPLGSENNFYWTIRPDTPAIEFGESTTSNTLTYRLDKDVLYHIGCQAKDKDGVLQRGDFHIDRRPNPKALVDRPNVYVVAAQGNQVTLHCDLPRGVSDQWTLRWTLLNTRDSVSLPQFDNQQTITTTVPYPLLWDIDCGVFDKSTGSWSQWGYPIEFFSSGQPYIPTADACVPGEGCPGEKQVNACSDNACHMPAQCYTKVSNLVPTCANGTITSDSISKCRVITCQNDKSLLQVKACDKNGYFTLQRTKKRGGLIDLCLGSVCIGKRSTARSQQLQVCT